MRIVSNLVRLVLLMLTLYAGSNVLAQGTVKSVKFEGARVNYLDYGKGSEALVFIHGWSCNYSFWKDNLPAFTNKTRVIAIDLPGHGTSEVPSAKLTMDLFAKAINAVVADAGVRKAVLVGHSMGTPVVRQFYRLFPEKTLALVIVDGSVKPFGDKQTVDQIMGAFRSPNYKQAVEGMIGSMTGPIKKPEVVALIRTSMIATPQPVIVGAMEAMIDESIWKDDTINVPVLAVMAPNPFWTDEYYTYLRGIAPDVQIQKWEGVSHFLMMEEPQKFNDAVSSFLTSKKLLGYK
jgi:pimeloyl-ACP methyl ester carboxylesterase